MLELGILTAALAAAATLGLFTSFQDRSLAQVFAARFGLSTAGRHVIGNVRGHGVRIICGKTTELAVCPRRHDADALQFRPRAQNLFDPFGLGSHEPIIGDHVLEQRFLFKGDVVDIAAFATSQVRQALSTIVCEWSGLAIRAHREGRNPHQLVRTLEGLLELADAMASAESDRTERLRATALNDPDMHVRAHGLQTFLRRFPEQAEQVASDALRDPSPAVRFVALLHLPASAHPEPDQAELIRVATEPGPPHARRAAIHLIGEHGSLEASVSLQSLRRDRTFRRDTERAIARLQQRHGTPEGRVSIVGNTASGAVSHVEPES